MPVNFTHGAFWKLKLKEIDKTKPYWGNHSRKLRKDTFPLFAGLRSYFSAILIKH